MDTRLPSRQKGRELWSEEGGGGGGVRELMKTINLSPYEILEAFPEVRQPQSLGRGASLQVSVRVLIYAMRVSLLFCTSCKYSARPQDHCLQWCIGMFSNALYWCTVAGVLMICHVYVCRRCGRKRWRRHPADDYCHPCRWPLWDLQDGWKRGPGVDFTLQDLKIPLYYLLLQCSPSLYAIKQAFLLTHTPNPITTLHSACTCSPVVTVLFSTKPSAAYVNVPTLFALWKVNRWILSHSYQSFSFHGGFKKNKQTKHFILYVNFVVFYKCCTTLFSALEPVTNTYSLIESRSHWVLLSILIFCFYTIGGNVQTT